MKNQKWNREQKTFDSIKRGAMAAMIAFAVATTSTIGFAENAFAQQPVNGAQEPAKQDDKKQDSKIPAAIKQTGKDKIKFTFDQSPWPQVIKHFTDEAGFHLQPEDVMPEGSFQYSDTQEFTVLEGFDILNRALAMKEYTLLRNKKIVYLIRVDRLREEKFRDFVEWVKPEDLEKRGLYEIMQVEFDLGDLDTEEIRRDVEQYVGDSHRRAFKLALGAKKMVVRENGGSLRKINALINSAQLRLDATKNDLTVVKLEHGKAEDVMPVVRALEGLDENGKGQDISVFVDNLMDTLYIRGNKSRVEGLVARVRQIDKQQLPPSQAETEEPYLHIYKVVGDAEAVFKVVVTMIQNTGLTGIIIDRMPNTGEIIVSATKTNHSYINDLIVKFQTPRVVTVSIDLNYLTPSAILSDLETFYPMDVTEEEGEQPGLKFLEDTTNDRLIIRGPPLEVEGVKELITKLDVPLRTSTGPRKSVRLLSMSDSQQERAIRSIEDFFSDSGTRNRIEIIGPRDRNRGNKFLIPPTQNNQGGNNEDGNNNDGNKQGDDRQDKSGDSNAPSKNSGAALERGGMSPKKFNGGVSSSDRREFYTSLPEPQDQEKEQETDKPKRQATDRKNAKQDEVKSVPGAPIKVKMTELGLMLASDDLDKLDEIEDFLRDHFDMESVGEAETKFFQLAHRDPQKVLTQLENLILGPESGGGGGGGGGNPLGNMMGNVMQNAMGMNPLDLLGGGGGDDGALGILPMQSDVVLHADTRLKGLWVKAVPEDLDLITEVINIIDREQPYHNVNELGKTRRIPIKHRDPSEVEQLIRNQMGSLIEQAGGAGQANNPQAAQAAMQQQMMRQMQQLMGGGGRRRGGGGAAGQPEDESPKATMGVDPQGRALLVTGPEYIADLIDEMVAIIDVKQEEPQVYMAVIETKGKIDPNVLGRAIQGMLGDKAQSNVEGGTTTPGTTGRPGTTTTPGAPGSTNQNAQRAQQMQQDAMRALMQRAMQNRTRGGGGTTRGGGGNTRGGGGGRGGRGGRG